MRDLGGEEVEEAVELVRIAPHRRRQLGRIASPVRPRRPAPAPAACRRTAPRVRARGRRRLRRSGRRAARRRPRSSPRSVRSRRRARGRGTARRSSSAGAPCARRRTRPPRCGPPRARRCWSRRQSRPGTEVRSGRGRCRPLPRDPLRATRPPAVTAPPYDVLTPELRDAYRARDPHNVVHLTLNDSEEEAGRLFRAWLDEGVLVRDDEPPCGRSRRTTSAPTASRAAVTASSPRCASSRTRRGRCCPHERTHAGPKEGRLRLLRAARAQLEPIFLLYDGEPARRRPRRSRARPRRRARRGSGAFPGDGVAEAFADRQLLIADGHHRYETALAYAAEEGTPESARMMVVLVSTSDAGLEIFPTHRLFRGHEDALPPISVGDSASPAAAVARLAGLPYDRAHAVGYRRGRHVPGRRRGGRARRRARRPARRPRGARLHGRISARRSPASTRASSTGRSCCARRASRTCSSAPAAAR